MTINNHSNSHPKLSWFFPVSIHVSMRTRVSELQTNRIAVIHETSTQ